MLLFVPYAKNETHKVGNANPIISFRVAYVTGHSGPYFLMIQLDDSFIPSSIYSLHAI